MSVTSPRRIRPVATSNLTSVDFSLSDDEDTTRIVEQCRLSQPRAQGQLYEAFQERVFRLAAQMTNREAALDITQRVFALTFQEIKTFAGHSLFDTWLHRVTVNEALQYLRREKRHRLPSLPTDCVDSSPDFSRQIDDRELLEMALQRIDPELRTIFLLREVDQLSYRQLASVLQMAEGTVGSTLSRARSCLREVMLELGWQR